MLVFINYLIFIVLFNKLLNTSIKG